MINAVGREIPGEILKKTGKEPFKGAYAYDNHEYKKRLPPSARSAIRAGAKWWKTSMRLW